MTAVTELLAHPAAPTVLTAAVALVVIAVLVWTLGHLRREHCPQIVELQEHVAELQTLVVDLIDYAEPGDLFAKPGLSPRLRAFRDHAKTTDQMESHR
jgi:hypothetical protein